MSDKSKIILAAKCAPVRELLEAVSASGIGAVELYLSIGMVSDIKKIVSLCRNFPLKYALHAPNDGYCPVQLKELSLELDASSIVMHDMFWDDEWQEIARIFKDFPSKICVENIRSVHEPLRIMRRYKTGRCVDLEHLQMECSGLYSSAFMPVIKEAGHIHMTGYYHGSEKWHTHIHHSPEHSVKMLDLVTASGYSGLVVSEAEVCLQTLEEFRALKKFFDGWQGEN